MSARCSPIPAAFVRSRRIFPYTAGIIVKELGLFDKQRMKDKEPGKPEQPKVPGPDNPVVGIQPVNPIEQPGEPVVLPGVDSVIPGPSDSAAGPDGIDPAFRPSYRPN